MLFDLLHIFSLFALLHIFCMFLFPARLLFIFVCHVLKPVCSMFNMCFNLYANSIHLFLTGFILMYVIFAIMTSKCNNLLHALKTVKSFKSLCFLFNVVMPSLNKISYLILSFLILSSLNFCMYTTLGQGQEMTLTFITHISSYIQLYVCSYKLSGHWLQ